MNHDQYASGPFSRVYFLLKRGELRTYTNFQTSLHQESRGTLVRTIFTEARLIDTSWLAKG